MSSGFSIEKRNKHLDEVLGIKDPDEIIEAEPLDENTEIISIKKEEIVKLENDELEERRKKDIIDVNHKIEKVYDKMHELFETHMDISIDFGKSRDVEATTKIASILKDLLKDKIENNEKLYRQKKEEDKTKLNQTNIQNNIIFQGGMRELLNEINNNT